MDWLRILQLVFGAAHRVSWLPCKTLRRSNSTCSSRVSLLSRYGTCPEPSTNALITRPSVSRLLLISPASFARTSTAPDLQNWPQSRTQQGDDAVHAMDVSLMPASSGVTGRVSDVARV